MRRSYSRSTTGMPAVSERTCPVTGEPLPDDRFVSGRGMGRYEMTVAAIPDLMGALTALKAGQVKRGATMPVMGCQTGSRPACALGVVAAADPHERTLLKWSKWCAREIGLPTPQTWPSTAFALRGGARFTGREWAATMVTEVMAAIRAIQAIIDPEPKGRFHGRCLAIIDGSVCDEPIYAADGTTWARCPACGTQWDLPDLLEQHLGVAADYLVTPDEGVAILKHAGFTITSSTIRSWKARGKVAASSGLYRIGDLLSAAV